ncbi:hypothetical protein OQA88_9870 [Cercophora sp. LCS_1]
MILDTPGGLGCIEDLVPKDAPGRLARRFLEDLLNGRFVYGSVEPERGPGQELSCSALRDPSQQPHQGSAEHDLIVQPTQTITDDPAQGTTLSCMCCACRYHFVIRILPGTCGTAQNRPQHHYVLRGAQHIETAADTPPNLSIYEASYECSGCPQRVTVTVSSPRLKWEWITRIVDKERIRNAIEAAKSEDPTRYANISEATEERWMDTPLETLNHYLKDALQMPEPRRINARNKTFTAQFGTGCGEIFRYLGYNESMDEESHEPCWIPPCLGKRKDGDKTQLGSMRAFLEDVRSEVQSVIEQNVQDGFPPLVELVLPKGRVQLEQLLRIVPARPQASTTVVTEDEAQSIDKLGTTADADDELLKWAYQRQVAVDPSNKNDYLGALSTLAARRDMDLQLFCFAQQDDSEHQFPTDEEMQTMGDGLDAVNAEQKAYAHFNTNMAGTEPPEYFVNLYRARCTQSPAQKADHRDQLYRIGLHRDKMLIHQEAMTFADVDEACHYLKVDKAWPLESIAVVADLIVESAEHPHELILAALNVISQDRSRDETNNLLWENIIAKLNTELNGQFLIAETPLNGEQAMGDPGVPAGLENITNTCYLNSILQYFYTVDAVRELVLGLELPSIDPETGRLPGEAEDGDDPGLDRRKAYVGCEFVRELRGLFEQLNTTTGVSVRPRQRLANVTLLRADSAPGQTNSAAPVIGPANRDAPALPPRAPANGGPKVSTDIVPEAMETASVVSSQTLVDKPDDDLSATVEPAPGPPRDGESKRSTRNFKELADEINKTDIEGSGQMDVDEVMGNAFDHLQAAFKIAHHGKANPPPDPIQQSFFSTWTDNRRALGETGWNKTPRTERWMTAVVEQGGAEQDLYNALSGWFGMERMEQTDKLQFGALERPAPHLHICLIRNAGGDRINAPVSIPETLYLDRFMQPADESSALSQAKRRAWDITNRLKELGSVSFKPENERREKAIDDFLDTEVRPGEDGSSRADLGIVNPQAPGDGSSEADLGIANPQVPEDGSGSPSDTAALYEKLSGEVGQFWDTFERDEAKERANLEGELATVFEPFGDHPYRLHAVICHVGRTYYGHYFVYIRDFKSGQWYKYNDNTVSVHSESSVLKDISTTGQPYYLAYVDAKRVGELVSRPPRAGSDQGTQVQAVGGGSGAEDVVIKGVAPLDLAMGEN